MNTDKENNDKQEKIATSSARFYLFQPSPQMDHKQGSSKPGDNRLYRSDQFAGLQQPGAGIDVGADLVVFFGVVGVSADEFVCGEHAATRLERLAKIQRLGGGEHFHGHDAL